MFFRRIQIFFSIVLLFLCGSCFASIVIDPKRNLGHTLTGTSRPNVIIIYADDLGYGDLGCYGCKDISTPNIDRLASEGVRFTDGYVSAPQCGPSRVGLLSGKYQNRFGYEYNPSSKLEFSHGFPLQERTLADLMKARGYTTGLIGKWHLGLGQAFHPNLRGFDEFFGTLHGHSNFVPPFNRFSKKHKASNFLSDIQRDGQCVDEKEYLTDAFTREAVSFIARYQDRPFFLYLPYTAPHGPLQAIDKYYERYNHIPDKRRQTYAAMVTALDDGVGKLMAELKTHGLEDKTLVFFISDNGATQKTSCGNNEPLFKGKGSLHEGGIRVPFILRWRGTIPAGIVDTRPVIQLDASATALAIAGGRTHEMDGVNLIPFLLGQKNVEPHRHLFWRIMSWDYHKTGEPYQKAIRRGPWKLIMTNGIWQLFNLKDDISEQLNLAAHHPKLVRSLIERWNQWEATIQFPQFPADSSIFPWKKLKQAELEGK